MTHALFFIYILILVCPAYGQEISSQSFQVNIRPQVSGIVGDFYQILKAQAQYPVQALEAKELVDQMRRDFKAMAENKNGLNLEQKKKLSEIIQKSYSLEHTYLEFLRSPYQTQHLNHEGLLAQKIWLDLIDEIHHFQQESDKLLLSSKPEKSFMKRWGQMAQSLEHIHSYIKVIVIEFVQKDLKTEYQSAYLNFIAPLEEQCLFNNNIPFIEKNMPELNFYWNLLNVKLTKRMKSTPVVVIQYINVIHNRWNQIVKTLNRQ